MAADGMPDSTCTLGDATTMSLGTGDIAEGTRVFDALSAGGSAV